MSLQKGFFKTQSSNPILPPEEWELVVEFTNPGSYSQSFDWGIYKVVLSGAGGSGAAAAQAHSRNIRYANNGSAGEQNETIINVYRNQPSLFSFVIAAGAQGSYAKGTQTPFIGNIAEATVGGVGTGYENGLPGTKATGIISSGNDEGGYAVAGGSGGGSSSLSVNGVVTKIAKGGNGGGGEVKYAGVAKGGIGGSGGTSNGNGASGGNAATVLNGEVWSNAGANGYARIYKSNLKPEPL